MVKKSKVELSIYEGYDVSASESGVSVAELFNIPAVGGLCAWREIGECPYGEHHSRQRPCKQGESGPLQQFAEVIGGCDISEQSAFRNVMVGISRFPQASDYMVGVKVDDHPGGEYQSAEYEYWRCEPVGGISDGVEDMW